MAPTAQALGSGGTAADGRGHVRAGPGAKSAALIKGPSVSVGRQGRASSWRLRGAGGSCSLCSIDGGGRQAGCETGGRPGIGLAVEAAGGLLLATPLHGGRKGFQGGLTVAGRLRL